MVDLQMERARRRVGRPRDDRARRSGGCVRWADRRNVPRRPRDVNSRLVWLGGRATPLVTVHLSFVDVGLNGAAAWEDGRPGVLAGASFLLTL